MNLRPAGPDAVLVEFGSAAEVLAAHRRLGALDGIVDLVPAARTVLVVGRAGRDPAADVRAALAGHGGAAGGPGGTGGGDELRAAGGTGGGVVSIEVVYDGPDLAEVAGLTGLGEDEVVARHAGADYVVAFCGFAPGFAYLTGLPAELHVPRRATPRTAVDAGSVGLAGEFTAAYPRRSPGGWQLIGRTDAALWDLDRDPPALLAPGTLVRFVPC